MKKLFLLFIGILLFSNLLNAQRAMTPKDNYKVVEMFPGHSFSAFDIYQNFFYGIEGDTVRCFSLENYVQVEKYAKPSDYAAFASFLTVAPDGKTIWVGFTVSGNLDDRIYMVDVETKNWKKVSTFACNFDLEFWNGKMLLSGLNDPSWSKPNSIFLLDTTAAQNHKKIIEIGGSSAGLGVDKLGNVYYGSYQGKKLYRWAADSIAKYIKPEVDTFMKPENAVLLSKLPEGAYDCASDDAGNIVFNFNSATSDKILAKWNGTESEGFNLDTIAANAASGAWLTMLKAKGNINDFGEQNCIYALDFSSPLVKIYKPTQLNPTLDFRIVSAIEDEPNIEINLNKYYSPVNSEGAITYSVLVSNDTVVGALIKQDTLLVIDFLKAGQSNVWIEASLNGQIIKSNLIVGVQPKIEQNYVVSDFENITLAADTFWNGKDATGSITSGLAKFVNYYNNAYGIWASWACSNITDNTSYGYANQYSAVIGSGFDQATGTSKNYGVAFADFFTEGGYVKMAMADNIAREIKGVYVTNTTWAALSMQNGDIYAKKFGGPTGNDPDYYKILAWGTKNGVSTDKLEFYLADFRFDDNSKDYIVKTWQWLDLSALGEVDSLLFSVASSDVGAYGMNTPAYFAADNFMIVNKTDINEDIANTVKIFPNPSDGIFFVKDNANATYSVKIYNISGKIIYSNSNYFANDKIDISNAPAGMYIVEVQTENYLKAIKIVKE